MYKKVIISLLALSIGYGSFAYPITPRPLRKLIAEADVIVWADVVRIDTLKDKNSWDDAKAILVIREVLQGTLREDTIQVFHSLYMVCPAPAYYRAGTQTLAFLNRMERKGEFNTCALSYGSKIVTDQEYLVYKQRISEMHEIQKITDSDEKATQTIDWLLRCALNPATRWEGVYELSPESDFMSYYDNDLGALIPKAPLSAAQKQLVRKALFSVDTLQFADLGLVDLAANEYDPEIADFLVVQLELESPLSVWLCQDLFVRIAALANRPDLNDQIVALGKLDYFEDGYATKLNEVTKDFVKQYKKSKKR